MWMSLFSTGIICTVYTTLVRTRYYHPGKLEKAPQIHISEYYLAPWGNWDHICCDYLTRWCFSSPSPVCRGALRPWSGLTCSRSLSCWQVSRQFISTARFWLVVLHKCWRLPTMAPGSILTSTSFIVLLSGYIYIYTNVCTDLYIKFRFPNSWNKNLKRCDIKGVLGLK